MQCMNFFGKIFLNFILTELRYLLILIIFPYIRFKDRKIFGEFDEMRRHVVYFSNVTMAEIGENSYENWLS